MLVNKIQLFMQLLILNLGFLEYCRFTIAMFPSPCFFMHFEVLHQKRVMEKILNLH